MPTPYTGQGYRFGGQLGRLSSPIHTRVHDIQPGMINIHLTSPGDPYPLPKVPPLLLDAVFIRRRSLFEKGSIQATGCSARISALHYPDRAEAQSADWPMSILYKPRPTLGRLAVQTGASTN